MMNIVAIEFILLVLSVFIGYVFGYVFTETKYNLSKYKLFQFKAFECRPCLSFHISWVVSTFISLLFSDIIMLIFGIIFAFIMWIGLKVDQKSKTMTIEEYNKMK